MGLIPFRLCDVDIDIILSKTETRTKLNSKCTVFHEFVHLCKFINSAHYKNIFFILHVTPKYMKDYYSDICIRTKD